MPTDATGREKRNTPYGSARDLPSYQELAQLLRGGKVLTRFVARNQRAELIALERELERLVQVVDDFYLRLGARNWVFNDSLNVDRVERLLAETTDAQSAEASLIEMYLEDSASARWTMRLRAHEGLRARMHQIERAREHYGARHFDSCTLHLIAVMDGFVNDFDPAARRGLHSRDPEEMAAWNSVVGHHMGLSHAMAAFTKTIKKRVDSEVFEVHRNGIVHGSVVQFDNVIVATKAWNMLFAVADWATATHTAAVPDEPPPTWRELWASVSRRATYERYERNFEASTIRASDPTFQSDEVAEIATQFLDAWENGRWGIVARFKPSPLRSDAGEINPLEAKQIFGRFALRDWKIDSVTYDQASTAAIEASAVVDGKSANLRFRLAFWNADGNIAIPGQDEGSWTLAVWAPQTYLQ